MFLMQNIAFPNANQGRSILEEITRKSILLRQGAYLLLIAYCFPSDLETCMYTLF